MITSILVLIVFGVVDQIVVGLIRVLFTHALEVMYVIGIVRERGLGHRKKGVIEDNTEGGDFSEYENIE